MLAQAAAILTGVGILPSEPTPEAAAFPRQELAPVHEERAQHLLPPEPRPRSKKESWLAEKVFRRDVHVTQAQLARGLRDARRPPAPPRSGKTAPPPRIGTTILPVTTLFHQWTREALPLLPGVRAEDRFHNFLRDHFTNQATRMDLRLIDVLTEVARRFQAPRIEVISGYRSPKYNLMLRKKGHQVARASQHVEGTAVDFRVRGVKTQELLRYVRSLRLGGVGYYPRSQFVHSDTGRVRFWKGS